MQTFDNAPLQELSKIASSLNKDTMRKENDKLHLCHMRHAINP